MSTPKFQKGEDVILRSTTHPQFDGDYTVLRIGVCKDLEVRLLNDDGRVRQFRNLPNGFVYDLGNFLGVIDGVTMCPESELRKKHKPADMSFESLLTSLNSDDVFVSPEWMKCRLTK